jgi:biotin transport system substrate-specific component
MSLATGDLVSHPGDPRAARDIDRVLPAARPLTRSLLVIGFALLTWAGARVAVPLPFTPVPGTLQTLAVLMAGAMLGARAGAASQLAYLLMGLAGLPVFALPGAGPAYFLGPTGGYLVGFILAAWTTGSLTRRLGGFGVWGAGAAFLAGAISVHACGLAWLTVLMGSPVAAWRAGMLPFLLFDLAKVMVATGVHTGYLRWKVSTQH